MDFERPDESESVNPLFVQFQVTSSTIPRYLIFLYVLCSLDFFYTIDSMVSVSGLSLRLPSSLKAALVQFLHVDNIVSNTSTLLLR